MQRTISLACPAVALVGVLTLGLVSSSAPVPTTGTVSKFLVGEYPDSSLTRLGDSSQDEQWAVQCYGKS